MDEEADPQSVGEVDARELGRRGADDGQGAGGQRAVEASVGPTNRRSHRYDAKLTRITLHEARHTFASLTIAAGVNAKALSTFMGHANISITPDRYGHLFPRSVEEEADRLDACLERAAQRAVGT